MLINAKENQFSHGMSDKILFVLGFFLWVLNLKYMHVVSSAYMKVTFKVRAHVVRPK